MKSFDDNIYILNSYGDLFKYNLFEYNLNLIEKIKIKKLIYDYDNDTEYDCDRFCFSANNFFVNKDYVFIWSNIVYHLIYDDEKNKLFQL